MTTDEVCRVFRVPPWLVDPAYPAPRWPWLAFVMLRCRWRAREVIRLLRRVGWPRRRPTTARREEKA